MAIKLFQSFRNAQHAGIGLALDFVTVNRHDLGLRHFPATLGGAMIGWAWYAMSASYTAADFTETKENGGTIAMSANGLLFTTGAVDGNACHHQLIRSIAPASNKVQIYHARVSLADVTNTGFVFGGAKTVADWFAAEADDSLAFLKAKGAATVVGRSTATLATLANGTLYDLTAIYDGYDSKAIFGIKAATAKWSTDNFTVKSTNLPVAALRMSTVYEHNEAAANTMYVDRYAWAVQK
jgi:hypothetical protein